MIARVVFAQQVAIPGTAKRSEYFEAPEWVITLGSTMGTADVRLYRPANPEQNITEVPRFRVVGVGFSVPEEKLTQATILHAATISAAHGSPISEATLGNLELTAEQVFAAAADAEERLEITPEAMKQLLEMSRPREDFSSRELRLHRQAEAKRKAEYDAAQGTDPGNGPSADTTQPAGVGTSGSDAGGAAEGPQQAQGRKARPKRLKP